MIAILGWTDGFGNDTYVWGIYPTLEIAKRYAKKELRWVEFDFGEVEYAKKELRWVEFDFGEVEFDWYDANEFRNEKHKPKKRKKKGD